MHEGDWLFVATMLVWFFVQLVASPTGAAQTEEGAFEQVTGAISGNAVQEKTNSLPFESWWGSMWWDKRESTSSVFAAPLGDSLAERHETATGIVKASEGTTRRRSAAPLSRRAIADAVSNHSRKRVQREDSSTSMTLD